MISYFNNKKADFSDHDIVLCSGVYGFSTVLASKIMVSQNSFEKIGFYFSEYCGQSVTVLPDGDIVNGEAYHNKDKKVLLIILVSGVPGYFKKKFLDELDDFKTKNKIKNVIVVSGFLPVYEDDKELSKKNNTVYYLTNTDSQKLVESGSESFLDLYDTKTVNLNLYAGDQNPKKEENKDGKIKELRYLYGIGFVEDYIKYQNKKKQDFIFLGVFIRDPLDIEAALSLYCVLSNYFSLDNKLVNSLNVYDDKTKRWVVSVPKKSINQNADKIPFYLVNKEWANVMKTN